MKAPVSISLCLALAACGGGGTSGDGAAQTASPQTLAVSASGQDAGAFASGASASVADATPTSSGDHTAPSSVSAGWTIKDLLSYPAIGRYDLNDNSDVVGSYPIGPRGIPTIWIVDGMYVTLHGDTYTEVPQTAFYSVVPAAINNAGQVAGTGRTIIGGAPEYAQQYTPFFYSNGTFTKIPLAWDWGTKVQGSATGLNDKGEVVGYQSFVSNDGVSYSKTFIYANGVRTDLDLLPGRTSMIPHAINIKGEVVGAASGNGVTRPFLYSNGKTIELGTMPGFAHSEAVDINAAGQIVGTVYNQIGAYRSNSRAFLYDQGVTTMLPAPDDVVRVTPVAINDRGQVAVNTDRAEGALIDKGRYTALADIPDIKAAGWSQIMIQALNNQGQFLGLGTRHLETAAGLFSPPATQ